MKRKFKVWTAAFMAATILGAGSITASAAPKEVEVNGEKFTFDTEFYAANNPDVAAALGNSADAMVQHYVQYGRAEGRAAYDGDAGAKATTTESATTKSTEPQPKYMEFSYNGDITEKVEYAYDGNGRLATEYSWQYAQVPNATEPTIVTSYSYNENGDVSRRIISSGSSGAVYSDSTYSYEYDSQGRILTRYEEGWSRIDYTYDKNGRLSKQVETLDGQTIGTCTYTYDKNGNMTKKSGDLDSGYDYTYKYDKQGRVASWTNMCGTAKFYY